MRPTNIYTYINEKKNKKNKKRKINLNWFFLFVGSFVFIIINDVIRLL